MFGPAIQERGRGLAERLTEQIRQSGITDPRILDAFRAVPRDAFVPLAAERSAWADQALPIGEGQTISQPSMVAIMLGALDCRPWHHALEVGAGSGYAAALLSRLTQDVQAIERHHELAVRARRTLASLGVTNVTIHEGDGTQGLAEHAPYDRILVSAAAAQVPSALLSQLALGGRLVMPVGEPERQLLLTCERDAAGELHFQTSTPCIFVPLISDSDSPR